jgi:transcriptional regulator with XRE-family HTH domain
MISKENNKCDKMLSMENFGDWLLQELEKRDWSQSDLVKNAGISRGTLSNIISGNRGVGFDSLLAIAHAFKISPISIFRKAGILPEGGDEASFADYNHLLSQLTTEEQEEIRQIMEMKIERRQKAEQSARSAKFKPGKVNK